MRVVSMIVTRGRKARKAMVTLGFNQSHPVDYRFRITSAAESSRL